jgi:hypothetical protein
MYFADKLDVFAISLRSRCCYRRRPLLGQSSRLILIHCRCFFHEFSNCAFLYHDELVCGAGGFHSFLVDEAIQNYPDAHFPAKPEARRLDSLSGRQVLRRRLNYYAFMSAGPKVVHLCDQCTAVNTAPARRRSGKATSNERCALGFADDPRLPGPEQNVTAMAVLTSVRDDKEHISFTNALEVVRHVATQKSAEIGTDGGSDIPAVDHVHSFVFQPCGVLWLGVEYGFINYMTLMPRDTRG